MDKERLAQCYVIMPLRGDFLRTFFSNAVNPRIYISYWTLLMLSLQNVSDSWRRHAMALQRSK